MSVASRVGRAVLASTAVVTVCATCVAEPPVNPGVLVPAIPEGLRRAAFVADVSLRSGNITVTAPARNGPSLSVPGDAAFSILAGDAIALEATNYRASAVGAFVAGKVRVTFDVRIHNRLRPYALQSPTFPRSPIPNGGPILFPLEAVVTTSSGGTSGAGTEIIVELPRYGEVVPSTDWNGDGSAGSGTPHNFFNDEGCDTDATDCRRWEAFGAVASNARRIVDAGQLSEARTIGFDVDPTVGQFRTRLILAADLLDMSRGALSGRITSTGGVPVAGARVLVAGQSATTNASGDYLFEAISTGSHDVTLDSASLPVSCLMPFTGAVAIIGGGSVTRDLFPADCFHQVGTVAGTFASNQALPAGLTVLVTPTGLHPRPIVSVSGDGTYARDRVPVGSGTAEVTPATVPLTCADPAPVRYSGLTSGGTITANFALTCGSVPLGYDFRYVVGSTSGNQVVIDAVIDMTSYNHPAINGADPDDVAALQASILYRPTELQFVAASTVPGSVLAVGSNGTETGRVRVIALAGSGVGSTGMVGFVRLTFNIVGSGVPARTTTEIEEAVSTQLVTFTHRVLVTEASIPRP